MRIALFATCIVDAMYPEVAQATVRVLRRLGHEVIFPEGQSCCGQMHINSGKFAQAEPVIANHVRAFTDTEWDVAVAPSASCVASLGHQQPMVARRMGNDALASEAADVADRTYELTQFLTDVEGVTDAAADLGSYFPHRVTYHPSCHGMRLLRLGDRQSSLVRSVEGIDFVELPLADSCCGFGGTFSVKNPEVSSAMLADKVRTIQATNADVCTGGDASCLLHIGGGISRFERTGSFDGAPDVTAVHVKETSSTDAQGHTTEKLTTVVGADDDHHLTPGEQGTSPVEPSRSQSGFRVGQAAVHLARILASTKEDPLRVPGEGAEVSGGSLR
ncbi:L-lactate dehydrogenase complex protein LldE [Brevibacterium iodinum ATCC 49514]|uniref:L-lactate dehydrogenase complex protein LldE n=1 Tax=Brevibacterium iodinum ATCC 49514 TaxID=1255616 RepID=A0A2H1IBL2_9MICO|nr:(Fe-S)-binding protein [Brevibacterium iodinum]SMX72601.1 L-lactate dehydrogenase complex protein LldE [Brevibacterium iodinum ATCC 49514]SUW13163.1 Lactate utilization protein A [Brevibacterium iodinum]